MNSKFLLDKIKRTNGNSSYNNYSNEFNNLKAKDSEYKKNYGKGSNNSSRHNSGGDLSWRKGSNLENIEENTNSNKKKGNFISDK